MSCDRLKLVEFGGYVNLNRHWASSLLTRMNFVKQKVTTAKNKYSVAEFQRFVAQATSGVARKLQVSLSGTSEVFCGEVLVIYAFNWPPP